MALVRRHFYGILKSSRKKWNLPVSLWRLLKQWLTWTSTLQEGSRRQVKTGRKFLCFAQITLYIPAALQAVPTSSG